MKYLAWLPLIGIIFFWLNTKTWHEVESAMNGMWQASWCVSFVLYLILS